MNEASLRLDVVQLLEDALTQVRVRQRCEQRLSPEQIAELASVDVATVWGWIREGRESRGREGLWPVEKLGHRTVRLRAGVVDRFLRSKEVPHAA